MTKKKTYENAKYFASANSGNGFFSLFQKIFDPELLARVYIIKGGSGTGKSSMMRAIGHKAERQGEEVEYYACSSDPDSLDGVILRDKQIAIIDGTPPHAVEPRFPGFADEIINTGAYWNKDKLEEKREELMELFRRKSSEYKHGYAFLNCAGKIYAEECEIIDKGFKYEKAGSYLERLFKKEPDGGIYCARECFEEGISQKGITNLATFKRFSEKSILICGERAAADKILQIMQQIFERKKHTVKIGLDFLNPEKFSSLYNETIGLSIGIWNGEEKGESVIINAARFLDAENIKANRVKLKFLKRCKKEMLSGAVEAFKEAAKVHEEIEKIYVSSMDFEALSSFSSDFSKLVL